jgi:hypothetical protein
VGQAHPRAPVPPPVQGLHGIAQLSAGSHHVAMCTAAGAVGAPLLLRGNAHCCGCAGAVRAPLLLPTACPRLTGRRPSPQSTATAQSTHTASQMRGGLSMSLPAAPVHRPALVRPPSAKAVSRGLGHTLARANARRSWGGVPGPARLHTVAGIHRLCGGPNPVWHGGLVHACQWPLAGYWVLWGAAGADQPAQQGLLPVQQAANLRCGSVPSWKRALEGGGAGALSSSGYPPTPPTLRVVVGHGSFSGDGAKAAGP